MANYVTAREQVLAGKKAYIESLKDDFLIRIATIADQDYINYDNIEGLVVIECKKPVCDCQIRIYHPTTEHQLANDWVITD